MTLCDTLDSSVFDDKTVQNLRCISTLNADDNFRLSGYQNDFLSVPGHGEQINERCGKVDHAVQCPNKCEAPVLHHYACHNLTCTCQWCVKAAIAQKGWRVHRRYKMMRALYKKVGISMGTLKHMSLSPDDPPTLDEFLKDRGKAFQQKAVDLLREHSRDHFFAGTVMIHPFRYDHQDGSCCEDPDCKLPHFWTYSPHIHYLGYGFLESSDIFHEKTGWIYVNIKPGKRRSLFATFIYELGHVGVFMRQEVKEFEGCELGLKWTVIGNVYRYVGLFSRECGGKEHLNSKKVVAVCHQCGEHLLEHEVDIKDTADPEIKVLEVNENHIIGEHMVWEVTERWHLNIKHYSWVSRFGKKGQTLKPKRKRLPDTRLDLDNTFITDSDEEFLIEDDGRP